MRLCADDFGWSNAVNAGIVALVRRGRLDAVSAMPAAPAFAEGMPVLLAASEAAPRPVEIGLHLALTGLAPLGDMPRTAPEGRLPSIKTLFARAGTGRLDRTEIAGEIARQAERFREVTGRAPDFLDGHEHAHLVPGVGTSLMAHHGAWTGGQDTWVRACACPLADLPRLPEARVKAAVLGVLSGAFHARHSVPRNRWFYGLSGFRPQTAFAGLMRRWLALAARRREGALIMCHPGEAVADPADPIAATRPLELAYLASDAFLEDRRAALGERA